MAQRSAASVTLLLSLNMLFFMLASSHTCPINILQLRACANVLGIIAIEPSEGCCSLLGNLVAADAALCLCTALRAKVLGIGLNVPVDVSLMVNNCGSKHVEQGFKCP